jgi:hypothetical protein
MQIIDVRKEVAYTCMKDPPILRQLHASRCPMQKPDADIFFHPSDRRGGPALLNGQAIGSVCEASTLLAVCYPTE